MRSVSKLRVEFSSLFDKKLRKLPAEIIISFKETLELFLENPNHERLRRHFLKEKFAGYQSIDITDDYRALFREEKTKNAITVKFHLIGTHKELYTS